MTALAGSWWLPHILGIDTQLSYWYAFYSGVGPFLTGVIASVTAVLTVYLVFNCHQWRCWRIGRYPVAGGQFRTCRPHHPDPAVRGGLRAHHIHMAHQEHLRATRGGPRR